jgi:hypothetical protein
MADRRFPSRTRRLWHQPQRCQTVEDTLKAIALPRRNDEPLCADDRGRLIGEVTRSIEMQLTPASLQAFVRDGGRFDNPEAALAGLPESEEGATSLLEEPQWTLARPSPTGGSGGRRPPGRR